LRRILEGHLAVSENIISRLIATRDRAAGAAAPSPADILSDRELEVFRLFGEGCGTKQIASKLGIAPSTVESYRAAIKVKLGLASGTELVAGAARFVAGETGG
jgi:DNA-binding NarL/FixJ family response regulator